MQSTCCPRSGPVGRGQRGAKPRDSRECRGREARRGVKSFGQKPAGSEEHRVVWLEGNEHPLSCRVYQALPLGSAEIKLGVFQPHAFLTTPPVPGCGLVLCSAKLCDFFWWAGSHTLWAGLNSVMSLFPCLVILQLNNRHISVKACLLSWVLNRYSFRNTFQAFSF